MADPAIRYQPDAKERKWLASLVERANKGDAESLAELRRFLDRNPQIWQAVGDLAQMAEGAWVRLLAEGNTLAAESIKRQLADIRAQLAGVKDNVVERMLADQVVTTLLETMYLQTVTANLKGGTLQQETQLVRRLESAQRRHLAAIKSLMQTREMLRAPDVTPYLRVIGARAMG